MCVRGVYILILARAITQIINDSIFFPLTRSLSHEMEKEWTEWEKTTPTIKNEFKTIKSSVDVKGTNYLLSMILLLFSLLFLMFVCVCVCVTQILLHRYYLYARCMTLAIYTWLTIFLNIIMSSWKISFKNFVDFFPLFRSVRLLCCCVQKFYFSTQSKFHIILFLISTTFSA